MLTYKEWHKYIEDNNDVLEVKAIPPEARQISVLSVNDLGISDEQTVFIFNGEIFHNYGKREKAITIKWDKFLLETVLNGKCEYVQGGGLKDFQDSYFKEKFEREVND